MTGERSDAPQAPSGEAFAFETLHGIHLVEALLNEAVMSAKVLRTRYERLDRAIKSAESALADLYQITGEVWDAEAKKAETFTHPDGLEAAKKAATKGQCLFCEEPLPPPKKKPRQVCTSAECRRAYDRAWRRDHPRRAA